MTSDHDPSRLDELLQLLIDDILTEADIRELNRMLKVSVAARIHYRRSMRLHAALIRHRRVPSVVPMAVNATPRRPIRWLAAAACLTAGLFFMLKKTPDQPVARLSGSTAAAWSGSSPQPGNDRSSLLQKPLNLISGFAEISFRSGVKVIVEGPCRFVVTSESSMEVAHGRATVKVPHHLDGFHLDTPAGRITDLGTEFGVAVGSGSEGPVILTEVFDGEIEIPAENTPRKRLQSGDALAIVRETGGTRLVSTLGDYRVDLGDSARKLPRPSDRTASPGNLALGKPVTSPAHYAKEHGSVFPADSLTDGRLNDTGSPGDWSFWLAPNGDHGQFTVDLLDSSTIGRIDLQNTRNRTHGDRGLREISIQVSEDNKVFHEILHPELRQILSLPAPGVDFPFESFRFAPVKARYIKVVGISHYRNADRPSENPNEGGGLNEIRVFAR